MGLQLSRGRWVFVKRVPKRFRAVDRRGIVRIALRTDARAEAQAKAPAIEAELVEYWQALADGRDPDARTRYDAAIRLAEARGFTYRPIAEIAAGDLSDLIARLDALARPGGIAPPAEVAALLGGVEAPRPKLSAMFSDYLELTVDRLAARSVAQRERWKAPRARTVRTFIEVVGDLIVAEITRDDALAFRAYWQAKVAEGLAPNSANKQFGHLSDIVQTVSDFRKLGLDNPFRGLRLADTAERTRPPFSANWIADRLLAPGALDGLNVEARDVLLMLVNTGARPSEFLGSEIGDFRLDEPIPFFRIAARPGRALKTKASARDVPLIGVSLDAAKRLRDAGGVIRYQGKGDQFSAAVNKFLKANGLIERTGASVYSLRHSFEDALLEAGIDGRIRADLMGHSYDRPKYGAGGRLATVAKAIEAIAFF